MKLTIKLDNGSIKVVKLNKDLEFTVAKGEQYVFSNGFTNYVLNFKDDQESIVLVFNIDGKSVQVVLNGIVPHLQDNVPGMDNPTAVIINKNADDEKLNDIVENAAFNGSEILDKLALLSSKPVDLGFDGEDSLSLITNFESLLGSLGAAAAGPDAGGNTNSNGSTFSTIFGNINDTLSNIAASDSWENLPESISSLPIETAFSPAIFSVSPEVPSITISDSSVKEEDGVMTFTVSLSNPSSDTITVDFATADGTAKDVADYLAQNGTVTFAPGETSKTITVPVVNDDVYENPESMFVNLTNATNATIADEQGEGRIADNDVPSFSVSGTEVVEGQYAVFNIQLSNASDENITLSLKTKEGTATELDYTPEVEVLVNGSWVAASTVTIPAGETDVQARVKTTDDDIDEPVENFELEAELVSGTTSNDKSSGSAAITDNDGEPQIVISDSSVKEEDGVMTFTVSLSNPSSSTVTVDFATANDTALSGLDYVKDSGMVTFLAGETSKTITIPVLNDDIFENEESMHVNLTNATNATIADDQGEGRIKDNPNEVPTLSISDSVVTEGDFNVFTVQISNPSSENIKFKFSTTDGTATKSEDYNPDLMDVYEVSNDNGITWSRSDEATIKAGDTAILVRIPTLEDDIAEGVEDYTLTATVIEGTTTNNTYPTGANATGTGTIIDDDATQIIIGDAVMDEQNGMMVFKVSLTTESSSEVTVTFKTEDDSAEAGKDYTSTTGTVTFPAGTTVQYIQVPINDDNIYENDENFKVLLENAVNAEIADDTAIGTIKDNDLPTISINDASVVEGDPAQFVISLSNPSTEAIKVDLGIKDIDTTSGDYSTIEVLVGGTWIVATEATIPAGETSVVVRVNTVDDNIANEASEKFQLEATVIEGDTNNPNAIGTGTIIDNDTTEILIGDSVLVEQDGVMQFVVSLTNPSVEDVTVDFVTQDGTSKAGLDYTATSGSITFPAGVTEMIIEVPINDDYIKENDETFDVILSNPSTNATIGDKTGVGVIKDEFTPGPEDTITMEVFAVVNGDYVKVNEIAEQNNAGTANITGTYVVLAIDSNGNPLVSQPSVETVDVNIGAVLDKDNNADHTNIGVKTVNLGTVFTVDSIDDVYSDNGETFDISVVNGTFSNDNLYEKVEYSTKDVATTITDSSKPTTPPEEGDITTITLSTNNVNEDNGVVTFTASVDNPTQTDMTIITNQGNITIKAGESTGVLTIDMTDSDSIIDPTSITATVTETSGGNFEAVDFSNATATALVEDTINTTTVTVGDATVNEDATSATVSVKLEGHIFRAGETVTVELSDGTTVDFTSNGTQSATFTFAADSDSIVEGDVTSAINATVSSDEGTIENPVVNAGELTRTDVNDTTTVTVGDATVNEDATSATVSVKLEGHIFRAGETVTVELSDGTTVDFTSNGTQSATFTFAADSDSIVEGDVTSAINATVSSDEGTIENPVVNAGELTVEDSIDDTIVSISGDNQVLEGDTATYIVSVTNTPHLTSLLVEVTVGHKTTDDGDLIPVTKTVEILPGETTAILTVDNKEDGIVESSEDYTVKITNATGGNYENLLIGNDKVQTTIVDDDTPPEASDKDLDADCDLEGKTTGLFTLDNYDEGGAKDIDDDADASKVTQIRIDTLPEHGTLYYEALNGDMIEITEAMITAPNELILPETTNLEYQADPSYTEETTVGTLGNSGGISDWGVVNGDGTITSTSNNYEITISGGTVTVDDNNAFDPVIGSAITTVITPSTLEFNNSANSEVGLGLDVVSPDENGNDELRRDEAITVEFDGLVTKATVGFDGMAGHFPDGASQEGKASWIALKDGVVVDFGYVTKDNDYQQDFEIISTTGFDELIFYTDSNSLNTDFVLKSIQADYLVDDSFDYTAIDSDGNVGETATVRIDINDETCVPRTQKAVATEDGREFVSSQDESNDGINPTGNLLDGISGITVAEVTFGSQTATFPSGTSDVDGEYVELDTPYGLLKVYSDGDYEYTVDNANAIVDALNIGDSLTEDFTFAVTNGTKTSAPVDFEVEIKGSDDAPEITSITGNNQGYKVVDGLLDINGDGVVDTIDPDDLTKVEGGTVAEGTKFLNESGDLNIDMGDVPSSMTVEYNGGQAGYHNVLGYYTKDDNGDLEAHIIYAENQSNVGSKSEMLGTLTNLTGEVGFFIIPNGENNGITTSSDVIFNNSGEMVINGQIQNVYYSDNDLNNAGIDHVVAGMAEDGSGIVIAFEDLELGDRDYDDFVITINACKPLGEVTKTTLLVEDFEDVAKGTDETVGGTGWYVDHGTNGDGVLVSSDGNQWQMNNAGIEMREDGGVHGLETANDSDTYVELDAHTSGVNSSIITSVDLGANDTYDLSFNFAPRPGSLDTSDMLFSLGDQDVQINVDSAGEVTHNAPNGVDVSITEVPGTPWYKVEATFNNILSSPANLNFAASGSADTLGAYIDNIKLVGNDYSTANTILTDINLSDVDNATLSSAKVELTNFKAGDVIDAPANSYGINVSVNSGVVVLTGVATKEQYEEVLESLTFTSTSEDRTPRTLEFTVNDGVKDSNTMNLTLDIGGCELNPHTLPNSVDANDDYGKDTVQGEITIASAVNGDQENPDITYLDDGGYVVVWEESNGDSYRGAEYNNETEAMEWVTKENHDVFAQRFDKDGELVGDAIQVNTHDARDQHDANVTALTGGRYLVTWTSDDDFVNVDNWDNGSRYIKGRIFDENNNPVCDEFIVSRAEYDPIVGLPDGGFIVTWSADDRYDNTDQGAIDNPIYSDSHDGDEFGVFGQRFDAYGNEVGGRFQINTHANADQMDSDITLDSNGDIIVTWQSENQDGDSYGVYTQKFELTADGVSKVGDETQINTTTAGSQTDPEITALPNGKAVVTWENGTDIHAQIVDANGNKVGVEIDVTSNVATEANPVVSAVGTGFVIVWQSNEAGNNDIYAQQFDGNGVKVGVDTKVNTSVLGEQVEPTITTLEDGGYIIAWQNEDGISAQRFNADGTPYKVNSFDLDEDTSITIDVADILANDTDPEGHSFEVTSVSNPQNGTVVLNDTNNDGVYDSVTFTPNEDYNGPGTFDYTITDEKGAVDTATVHLDVKPKGEPSVFVGTLCNADVKGTNVTVEEGEDAILAVRVSGAEAGTTISLELSDDSAKKVEDYSDTFYYSFVDENTDMNNITWIEYTGSINVPENASTMIVKSKTVADSDLEVDEIYNLTATLSTGESANGTVTILENDVDTPPTAEDRHFELDCTSQDIMYLSNDKAQIMAVNVVSGETTLLGNTGSGNMTDLAMNPNGTLYGISFGKLYTIDISNGSATLVANLGLSGSNAFEITKDGIAYIASYSSQSLYTLDLTNGSVSEVVDLPIKSGGDIAVIGNELYIVGDKGSHSGVDTLVKVDLSNNNVSEIGTVNYNGFTQNVTYGLTATEDGTLYAVDQNDIYTVNKTTAGLTLEVENFTNNGNAWGADFANETKVTQSVEFTLEDYVSDLEDDASSTIVKIRIDSLPEEGVLTVNGTAVKVGDIYDETALIKYTANSNIEDTLYGTTADSGTLDEWGSIDTNGVLTTDDGNAIIKAYSNDNLSKVGFSSQNNNNHHDGLGLGVVGSSDDDQIELDENEKIVMEFKEVVTNAEFGLASLGDHFTPGASQNAKAHWVAYKDGVKVAEDYVQQSTDDSNDTTNSFKIDFEFDKIEFTTVADVNSNYSIQYMNIDYKVDDSFDYVAIDSDGRESDSAKVTIDLETTGCTIRNDLSIHNIPDARITVTDITSDDSTTLTKAISHVKYFLSNGTTAKVDYADGVEIKDPNDPTKFIEEIERLTGSTVTDYYIKAAKNVYTDDGTFYDTFDKKGKLVTDPLTNQVTSGQEYSYNISTNEIYNFNSSSFEYKIVINASIVDTNNEESLNVVVSVPTGAVLSQGTDNSDGTWTINVNNSDLFTTELNVTSSTRIDADEISLKVTSTNENTNESVTNETGADNNNVLMMTGDSIDLENISLTNKIESISLEGNGSQTLNLDLSDVVDLTDIDNDLVIKGDLSDKVDLDNTEWTNTGTQEIDGSNYNVYTGLGVNSTVKLLIDDDIEITPDI